MNSSEKSAEKVIDLSTNFTLSWRCSVLMENWNSLCADCCSTAYRWPPMSRTKTDFGYEL